MTSATKLFGLVLSGGKSTRMGYDKGTIDYHGIPQREYMYRLLQEVCDRTFLSLRKDQDNESVAGFERIIDGDRFQGPFNGIFSAHLKYPDVAWLVVACDLPLLDAVALKALVQARDQEKYATAYSAEPGARPEPLCAIWEPGGLKEAMACLVAGTIKGPLKFLIDADIKMVVASDDRLLTNANTREDHRDIRSKYSEE